MSHDLRIAELIRTLTIVVSQLSDRIELIEREAADVRVALAAQLGIDTPAPTDRQYRSRRPPSPTER